VAPVVTSVTVSLPTTPLRLPQLLTTALVVPSYGLSSAANPVTVRPLAPIVAEVVGCASV